MQNEMRRRFRAAQDPAASSILGNGWISLRKAFEFFWKRKLLTFALLLIPCVLLAGYSFYQSLSTASTIVSLDYEEASKGLTPSQTRFNIYEIQSTEVMERLIDYAGLRGEITPDELSRCISVRATHDKNVSGKVNFISTSYIVEFTRDSRMQRRSAGDMLALLCKSYREFFVEHYGINHSILSFDIDNLKFNDEYLMSVDLLELKCSQLERYVHLRTLENKNYQDPDTGMTFSALEQRVSNFFTYDLARLRSYIIETGIANDRADLNAMLDYKIRMDRLVYNKMMAAYEEENSGIRMYDSAMSAVVMIPTEDSSLKYYMSRTKTGMDNMAIHADNQLLGAMEKQKEIDYNTYLIEKMRSNFSGRAQREKADGMIQSIGRSLEALASDIRTLDNSFASYRAHNYLSFRSSYVRFINRIDPIGSFLGAVLILVVAFTVVFLNYFFRKRDKAV